MTFVSQTAHTTATLVRTALAALQGIPPLRVHEGVTEAQVGGHWYPLDYLRQAVDESTLAALDHRGVPWTWLGGRATARVDDQQQWVLLLQENAGRSWVVAAALCDALLNSAQSEIDGPSPARENLIDQIHALLSSLAFSIKARQPASQDASRGLFRVSNDSDTVKGAWYGSDESLDLPMMLRARAQMVTRLGADTVQRLGSIFFHQVFVDQITVPGFQIVASQHPIANCVDWTLSPRTKEEAEAQLRQHTAPWAAAAATAY